MNQTMYYLYFNSNNQYSLLEKSFSRGYLCLVVDKFVNVLGYDKKQFIIRAEVMPL